jgi:rhodanese-related sulfurtransferase
MIRILPFLFLGLILLSGCSLSHPSKTSDTSPAHAEAYLEKTIYVDVREDDEWAAGHVDGALHVKLGDIQAGKFDAIPKDVPVALYCRSGRRSGIAYDILTKA